MERQHRFSIISRNNRIGYFQLEYPNAHKAHHIYFDLLSGENKCMTPNSNERLCACVCLSVRWFQFQFSRRAQFSISNWYRFLFAHEFQVG